MPHQNKLSLFQLLLIILSYAAACISIYQCAVDLQQLFQDKSGQDLHIFTEAGLNYKNNGQLYYRQSLESGPMEALYRPTSPVFKFPPAFQLQIIPFTNQLNNPQYYYYIRIIMLLGYFLACISLAAHTIKNWATRQPQQLPIFTALAIIIATSSDWLRMGIFMNNYEVPIFCILVAAYFSARKHPYLSGALVGYAASVKIYPAFFVTYFFTCKNQKTFLGFGAAAAFFSAIAFLAFGATENLYYFFEVLPTLLKEKPAFIYDNINLPGTIYEITSNADLSNHLFNFSRILFAGLTLYIYLHKPEHKTKNLEWFSLLLTLLLINLPNYWTQYRCLLLPACFITAQKASSSSTAFILLAICIAAGIPDFNTWINIFTQKYTQDEAHFIFQNAVAANPGSIYGAMRYIFDYSPWSVFVYFLTKTKALVPYVLWCVVAKEITAQPTSSNPERYKRA